MKGNTGFISNYRYQNSATHLVFSCEVFLESAVDAVKVRPSRRKEIPALAVPMQQPRGTAVFGPGTPDTEYQYILLAKAC